MSWFVFLAGVLYVLAAVESAGHGNWRMVGVSLAYAVANFMLMQMK